MSWDATLSVHVDGNEVEVYEANYTHNTNCMIRAAGFHEWWDGLVGMSGAESDAVLSAVLRQWWSDPRRFQEMNPENGWGDFAGLSEVIAGMRDAGRRFPSGRWSVWG